MSSQELTVNNNPLKASLLQFIRKSSVTFNYAATLTFLEPVSNRYSAEKLGRFFINHLNKKLSGREWWKKVKKDKTKQQAVLAILEGDGTNKHFHYHFALIKPETMTNKEFEWFIKECWQKTGNGSIFKNVVEPIYDEATWLDYITKEIKIDNTNALVLSATHIY